MPGCCDGTGWTGRPGVPCPEHYEPFGGFAQFESDTDPGYEGDWA